MIKEVDILENEIRDKYSGVLDILLRDHTTQKNIFWATYNYEYLGEEYKYYAQIKPELIIGVNGKVIMPRVKKEKELQMSRVKDMAEVFTPLWICNKQNNLIDSAWFGRENVFNTEVITDENINKWKTNKNKITFPDNKDWNQYISDTSLEIACGEAPYITSRYDTITGKYITIENRIGLLDRKLRVINENVHTSVDWLKNAQKAFMNTYAFEWHGDSLLLARESMLYAFIDNYIYKFKKKPLLKSIESIANIISWNVWQMDGLKGVIPNSCYDIEIRNSDLFQQEEISREPCEGCQKDIITKHNGIYCSIMDWNKKKNVRFIDLLI